MNEPPEKKRKARELTQETFDTLLKALHQDREAAAEIYEHLRRALQSYFNFRGAVNADELTDETITRVAARVTEGAAVFTEAPAAYFYGVARNIWREASARPVIGELLEDTLSGGKQAAADPYELLMQAEESRTIERQHRCLQKCLQSFRLEDRELLIAYYQGSGSAKLKNRQALAAQLGITAKTLRNRSCQLRARLSDCHQKCLLEYQEAETRCSI